jgi:hypothetical protein
MPTALENKIAERAALAQKTADIFKVAGSEDGRPNFNNEQLEEVRANNKKCNALADEITKLQELDELEHNAKGILDAKGKPFRQVPHPGGGRRRFGAGVMNDDGSSLEDGPYTKSLGERWVESDSWKKTYGGPQKGRSGSELQWESEEWTPDALKTTFSTTAGWDPFVQREPGFVPFAMQMPTVADLLPTGQTTQHSIQYMEETTNTNAAAETAEAGTYPESAYALTLRTLPIVKIAHFVPTTDEQLADEPQARSFLDDRLMLGCRQRLDSQLLNGSGTPPALKGFLNLTGLQTQVKSTDPTFDAILKAMVLVQTVGFASPSALIANPTDWATTVLLRTSQGIYILGNPSDQPLQRIWGMPVISTTYLAAGTMLTGDFARWSRLMYRLGLGIKISDSHSDWFIKGILAIRAEMRVALYAPRGAAFCKITGTF